MADPPSFVPSTKVARPGAPTPRARRTIVPDTGDGSSFALSRQPADRLDCLGLEAMLGRDAVGPRLLQAFGQHRLSCHNDSALLDRVARTM